MAILGSKRKPKKIKKVVDVDEDDHRHKFCSWFLCRNIPFTILLLFLIFLWSSSSTFISGSMVHVCVSSRKLSNLYCFSAGAQPANYTFPIVQHNGSELHAFAETGARQQPSSSTSTKLVLSGAQGSPVSQPSVDSGNAGSKEIQMNAGLPRLSGGVVSSIGNSSSREGHNSSNVDSSKSGSKKSPMFVSSLGNSSSLEGHNPSDVDSAKAGSKESQMFVSSLSNSSSLEGQTPSDVDFAKAGSEKNQMYDALSPTVYEGNASFSPFIDPILRSGRDKAEVEDIVSAGKHVEQQLVVLRSYASKSKSLDCDGRGIYVYDLPSKFNKDLLSQCRDMITWLDFCKYLTNDGMGEPIPELGKDWYNTHQYSLEPIFHSHVLNHPCRVQDWEDARLFYVPFYGGLDILRWHFKNMSNEAKDALSMELVDWLNEQKPWRRHFGMDHVFVLGKVSWDFRRLENGTWGTRLLELDDMQNPTKLMIERQPWQPSDVGVPHPTHFHPSSDEAILTWQATIRGSHRKNLVSFAGTPRWPPKGLRSVLIEQCTSSPTTCKFFDCRDQACTNPAPMVKLFTESEFCLQPPGDSPTRKSVFDALVAGCIPVVFDPFTAHYQYPWHLPEDHTKYSVYIDQEEVKSSKVNVIQRLMKIPLKEREEMRKYIIDELMPRLVYSHPNAKLNKFEDAFSVAVNSLFEMAASKLP